jgi:hypothetical protein
MILSEFVASGNGGDTSARFASTTRLNDVGTVNSANNLEPSVGAPMSGAVPAAAHRAQEMPASSGHLGGVLAVGPLVAEDGQRGRV